MPHRRPSVFDLDQHYACGPPLAIGAFGDLLTKLHHEGCAGRPKVAELVTGIPGKAERRLALANAIVDAGIERAKAERVASTIVDLIHDAVATKADVAAVRTDLKADIAAARADLHATESRLKGENALVEHRMITRLGGLVVVAVGIILAALRYLPPVH
jgi:hypothetical protein